MNSRQGAKYAEMFGARIKQTSEFLTEWEESFLIYQQYPEYKLKNFVMSLGEFKSILV